MQTPDPIIDQLEPPNVVPPKCKRRWLRFSLRFLLIVMLLFAVSFAYVAKRMREKQQEREAIADMAEHGGLLLESDVAPTSPTVVWLERWLGEGFFTTRTKLSLDGPMTDGGFDHVANLRCLTEVWVNNAELTAGGLFPLKDLHKLELIDLGNCSETETDLEFLDGMPSLTYLGLAWFHPTETGWQRIRRLPRLRILRLASQKLSDRDMTHLGTMKQLCELELTYCHGITDGSIEGLKSLTKLEALRLDGAHVSDNGMKHLEGLTRLKSLCLYSTLVTKGRADEFQEALPDCNISR